MSQVPAAVLATRVGLRSALTVARSSSARSSRSAARKHQLGGLGSPCTKAPLRRRNPQQVHSRAGGLPECLSSKGHWAAPGMRELVQSPGRTRRERLVVGLLCTVCGLCGRRMVNC